MTSETKDPPTDQIDRVWDHANDSNRFLGAMVLVKLVMFLTFIFFSLPFYKTLHEGVLHPYDGGRPMPGMPMIGVVIVALGCTAGSIHCLNLFHMDNLCRTALHL